MGFSSSIDRVAMSDVRFSRHEGNYGFCWLYLKGEHAYGYRERNAAAFGF